MSILFLFFDLQIPLIMLIVAIIMKRFPPRFRDGIGYHTSMAEKNELTWNTAQWLFVRYAVIFMVPATIIGAVGGILGIIRRFDEDTAGMACVIVSAVQTVLLFAAIILTEVGLYRRFDKNGNLK